MQILFNSAFALQQWGFVTRLLKLALLLSFFTLFITKITP